MIRILSLGAGVQSSAMALMAAHGVIGPMPDCAIFADTGWEPKAVYDHLAWLRSANVLPFPVHMVSAGNLRDAIMARINTSGGAFSAVPWFIRLRGGKAAMGRRQCTKEYKLRPLQKKVVQLLGGKRTRGGCEMWIGISTDEAWRVKPSQVKYIVNRHPLIELGVNRRQCLEWITAHGYPEPPKSSCLGCPFHSDLQWRAIKDGPPAEWQDVLEVDAAIRHQAGARGTQFMHRSLTPIGEVDLRTDAEAGQNDLFANECEGMCGV